MRRLASTFIALAAVAVPAAATAASRPHPPHVAGARHLVRASGAIAKRTWLSGVVVTEYYPTAEATCCAGEPVSVPGIPGLKMRVDFLYGATGLSMEGEAFGLDGHMYHIDSLGSGGWVNASGHVTHPVAGGRWTAGPPSWRDGGYWLSAHHRVTFPLARGGWADGVGVRYVRPPPGISFAAGPSRPLTFWKSVAVDPHLIPLGSRIFIPAYVGVGGSNGWFTAQDTGGAIIGRHIDVYRAPPTGTRDQARSLTAARVLVVPPAS